MVDQELAARVMGHFGRHLPFQIVETFQHGRVGRHNHYDIPFWKCYFSALDPNQSNPDKWRKKFVNDQAVSGIFNYTSRWVSV